MSYRLKCRKSYRKQEWNCRFMQNGTQKGSYNAKRIGAGYTLTPLDNVSCGALYSDAVINAFERVLNSGKCEINWKKRPLATVKKGKLHFQNYGIDHACLMSELKKEFKRRTESGTKRE